MSIKSYSQNNEDLIIFKYLSDNKKGSYIEIGTGDPVKWNNSYGFYKQGWRGILVEPFPVHHEDIKIERPEDKLCVKAITNKVGTIDMFDTAAANTTVGIEYGKRKTKLD